MVREFTSNIENMKAGFMREKQAIELTNKEQIEAIQSTLTDTFGKENENKELEFQTMKIESIQQQNDMKSQITIAKRNLQEAWETMEK